MESPRYGAGPHGGGEDSPQGPAQPEETEQFLRAARAAAQLKHPGIVSVHELGREGETVYIFSDTVQGATLADWLSGQQPTPQCGQRVFMEALLERTQVRRSVYSTFRMGSQQSCLFPAASPIDKARWRFVLATSYSMETAAQEHPICRVCPRSTLAVVVGWSRIGS